MPELVVVLNLLKPVTLAYLGGIIVTVCLLFLTAITSATETAYFSLTHQQIREIKTMRKKKNHLVIKLLESPKKILATILIFNNLVNIGTVLVTTWVVNGIFDFGGYEVLSFIVQVIVITSVILFIGEIMPKVYAVYNSMGLVFRMALPLSILVRLLHPFSTLMVRFSSMIDKRISRKNYDISMSYLSDAIDITSNESTPEQEKKILKGIVKFGDIEAKEIMKQRLEISAVEMGTPYHGVLLFIKESGYSRIPVFKGNLDNIHGILYIKDLLSHLEKPNDFKWDELLRPAFFVPENKKINDLLQEFREKKIHLAIVVDEYGGTSGIITLEDILEEIVGEIDDEYDIDASDFVKVDDSTYILEGKISLNDLCKLLKIEGRYFEQVRGEADTLAGLIIELSGKIPEKNESLVYKKFIFRIESRDARRIKKVKVTIGTDEKPV